MPPVGLNAKYISFIRGSIEAERVTKRGKFQVISAVIHLDVLTVLTSDTEKPWYTYCVPGFFCRLFKRI